jgi:parallel beta-helix repeat protein
MILPILNIIRKLVNNMYKSSIIGFFLLSSLIFGGANMMVLQGAATQDYYYDDKQYGDSSYSGYRDNNNNNYYPSKDYDNNKKYVCKNGPFEGFFVGSVEFCKPDITVPTDFPTIQAAINASNPGDTIKVLPGIYTEQLTISKNLTIIGSGSESTIVESPPLEDLEPNVIERPYIVEVNNETQVSMKGFTINGLEGTDCGTLVGISVLDNGSINLMSVVIKGCTQNAILIGAAPFFPSGPQVGHAIITKTFVTDYVDHGVFALGSGSTLTMSYNKIVGSNPNSAVVGILFVFGAKGTITHNEVSENICNLPECGPDFFTQLQSAGIVADSAGEGSVISNNYVSNNDAGIAVIGTSECCIIDYNKLTDNRFFGIVINDGEQTISNTKIFGGNIGVAAVAITANTVATLDNVKIIGATIPVQEIPSGGFTAEVVILSNSFQNSKDGKPYFDSEEVLY